MPDQEIAYPSGIKLGVENSRGVKRVQEWLSFHGHGTAIDGDFGPNTLASLNAFQRANNLPAYNFLEEVCWALLISPLLKATSVRVTKGTFGDAVVEVADIHLKQGPCEIGGDNRGPWVRHYCKGQDGALLAWCQGFASSVHEQAARALGVSLPIELWEGNVFSLYVPWVAHSAAKVGRLVKGGDDEGWETRVEPGSFFFVRSGDSYSHVGIVTGKADSVFYTIEGNTNDDGSTNGYKVAARTRSRSTCDFGVVD